MTNPRLRSLILRTLVAVFLAACAGSPGPSPSPAPSGGGPVRTEDEAIARVMEFEPRLAGVQRHDPQLIGQASWYEVVPASGVGAFLVIVRIGWGDCQASCIDEHTWVYAVTPDGTVTLQSEGGGGVPDSSWPSPGGAQEGRTGIHITAVAGPTCPVETVPPDPACAPKPVPNVVVAVIDADGGDHKAVLDGAGQLFVELAPGVYTVNAQGVGGFMNGPEAERVVVEEGKVIEISLEFDTGIR